MRNPSTDPPQEREIQNLIADGKFRKAVDKAWVANGKEIKEFCVNRFRGHVCEYVADGEGIAHEVFETFYKSIQRPLAKGGYNPQKARVRTFLFAIARKLVRYRLRTLSSGMRNNDAAWSGIDPINLEAAHVSDPQTALIEEERVKILKQAVDRLPSSDREIILLFYVHNHRTADIAYITGKERPNVRQRLSKIRAKLREEITGDK